jgi:ribonuclease Z
MSLSLTGFSTAGQATWWLLEEFKVLFDAGDGLTAFLGSKAGTIRHVFLSHADRDHIAGMLQFHQLHGDGERLNIYYPADSESIPHLETFIQQFDPHIKGASWQAIEPGARIPIGQGRYVTASATRHNARVDRPSRCLSFSLVEARRKLKAAFADLPGDQIRKLRQEQGDDHVLEEHDVVHLTYTADTPIEPASRWRDCRVLIHEATFLRPEDRLRLPPEKQGRHSDMPEVMAMAKDLCLEALVLSHFSARYHRHDICEGIIQQAKALQLPFPVYAVMPGRVVRKLLQQEPIWSPPAAGS